MAFYVRNDVLWIFCFECLAFCCSLCSICLQKMAGFKLQQEKRRNHLLFSSSSSLSVMSDFIAGDKRTISPSDKTGFSVTAVDNGQTLIVTESSKGDAQQQWNIQLINADSPSDGYKIQSAIADTYLATDTETNKLTQSKEPYTWFITPSDTNPRTIQCSSTNLFWNYDPNSIEQEVFLSGVPDPGQSGSGWQIDFSITTDPNRYQWGL